MRSLLKKIFIDHWPRKLVAFILAIVIWILVNHSMTTTRTFHEVPIKVINIPAGKTIEGLQDNHFLSKKLTITLTGNKNVLEDLTGSDLEVILDAENQKDPWIVSIRPKNLICLNPDIDIQKSVSKVIHNSFIIKLSELTTQRIPIHITQPFGEAPKGYQFLDIWPYQLYVTVSGPLETVKQLKTKGIKLTYNLNDISKDHLIKAELYSKGKDELSYNIPESWKKVVLPQLSSIPITIDDPQAKVLKMDFAKSDLLPIDRSLPIALFFPAKTSKTINPDTFSLATNDFINKKNGIKVIGQPLYAQGVSKLFLDIVKDMIQIVVIATTQNSKEAPLWNVEFIYPHELEDRYVAKEISQSYDPELKSVQSDLREEFLRNRFRKYMNKFRLFTQDHQKLRLNIHIDANTIQVTQLKDNATKDRDFKK